MDNKAMAFVVTLTQSGPDEIRERTIVVYTMNDNYVMEMVEEEMRSERWDQIPYTIVSIRKADGIVIG
jgi:hypothetical protein